jgi:cobalt-zinc-cadmium efflux system membrane fusion protein
VVTEIRAKPGDTMKAGDPIFTLQLVSELLQSTQTDLAKAARELEFATAKRDRVAELVKKGTQSGTVLIEEENQVKRFTTQVQAYRRQLIVFGLTTDQVDRSEKGEVITQVVVTAPLRSTPSAKAISSGSEPVVTDSLYEVQELKVTLGEQVQAGQTLCLLANHQKLFVEGRAFKSEADALADAAEKKTPIRSEFADENPGSWKPQEPLRIHHLSNQVDPATRTFAFYLPLDNFSRTYVQDEKTHFVWRYRPGQRVRLRMPVEKLITLSNDGKREIPPFVFPAGAVVREGAEAFMFVQSGDVFIRKPVHVLYEDRNEVVVANDGSITEAEFVVRNQAAAINRALKAAAAGGGGGGHEGHDHAH